MLAVLLPVLAAVTPIFNDVTARAGLSSGRLTSGSPDKNYILETIGTGAAAFDFDNDGLLDLYFANSSRLEGFAPGQEPTPRLFHNRGDGTFEDVSASSGLAEPFWGFGTAVGDYDNDGWTDLYVTAWGPNRLYHNKGDGTFEEVGRQAGANESHWGSSAAFADFDSDGALDLYVANYVAFDTNTIPRRGDRDHPCLYRGAMVMCGPTGLKGEVDVLYHNNGDGTFSNVTAAAGIRTDIGLFGLGVAAADYDADGDVDIYVANDATPNQLYRNRGDGTFDEVGALSGVAYGVDGAEAGSMGTSFGDYDGDGRLDLLVTNFSNQFYQLFHYTRDGFFDDVSFATGIAPKTFPMLGWATEFFDYDNDGYQDIFFANGHVYPDVDMMQIGTTFAQPNQLFRNVAATGGGRTFADVGAEAGESFVTPRSHRSGGALDFDGDGGLDLLLTVIDGGVVLMRNQMGAAGGWIGFKLVGTTSNRSAIGTRVTLKAGGREQVWYAEGGGSFLWGCDRRAHFGLGGAEKIQSVVVNWPSGRSQEFRALAPGRQYVLIEGRELAP